MDLNGSSDVEQALRLVGELLAADGHEYAVIVLGGAALNLLGIVERATSDVDILAFATPRANAAPEQTTLREPPEPIPAALARAAATVARDLGLDEHWLNTGPALQWRAGLPPRSHLLQALRGRRLERPEERPLSGSAGASPLGGGVRRRD